MHQSPNETNFRCCYGFLAKDHGAFNYLYRYERNGFNRDPFYSENITFDVY